MKQIITDFYQAFADLDPEAMVKHYHDEITFEDPAFGHLKGNRAKNMWRMLLANQKNKDFRVISSDIQFENETGRAHWEAFYTFSKTGRKVHNKIDAKLYFKDGKIYRHIDTFNLHKWAGQALGLQGYLIGWTEFFKKKFNAQTKMLLDKFEAT